MAMMFCLILKVSWNEWAHCIRMHIRNIIEMNNLSYKKPDLK